MSDSLASLRKCSTFNVLNDFNMEVLAIQIAVSLQVCPHFRVLNQNISWRGNSVRNRMDDGHEFISNVFDIKCKK